MDLKRAGIASKISKDPWGGGYALTCSPGFTPYIISAGPDRTFGTEDDVDNLRREDAR